MSKRRVLAGIMSLLLLITSVFTGNVVTARAEVASSEEYDAFGPDETNPTIVEVELLGYDRGEGPFPISFDGVNENNTIDGWDRMKTRVNGTSLTISWSADAAVKPLQICVEGAGENNSWLVEDVSENQNSYTINLTQGNRVSYLVQVKYQLDDGGSFTYGKDDMLAFNIANSDKGDVLFRIGEGNQYRVGGTEEVPDETIKSELGETTFAAGNTIKVWAAKYGEKVVGNFDIRIDGTSVFATDDARTAVRTDAEGESGYTFTVPEGYASTQLIEFQIEFRDDTSGSGSDPGDVVFNVTGGSGSTLQYSIDNKANWNNIPEAGKLTASELGGVSQIYLKATLSGEDVVSSRSSINVGGEDPITVSAETIGTGDFLLQL